MQTRRTFIRNGALVLPGSPLVPNPILVGDVFVAAFEIPTATVNGVNLIPAGQELTGVGALYGKSGIVRADAWVRLPELRRLYPAGHARHALPVGRVHFRP